MTTDLKALINRMKIILKIAIVSMIITGCNNSKQDYSSIKSMQLNPNEISTESDTLIRKNEANKSFETDTQSQPQKTVEKQQIKKLDKEPSQIRFINFPSDANFNGEPMTQQEQIPKDILEKYPDTLSKLAITRYKTYDYFFPKSIADNFEEGISTTNIHYPEALIFRFELFENKNANKPYQIKEVIVRRNPNGEVYTEN